ncbi:MAG: CHAT domain-containing protein [Pirellulaceae bacterium]|nr:CHAT domain-containing protein [Pirellulaceae bacterium]
MRDSHRQPLSFPTLFVIVCVAMSQVAMGQDLRVLTQMEEQVKLARLEGRYRDAERIAANAVQWARQNYGSQDSYYGAALINQSAVWLEMGKDSEAIEVARQAIAIITNEIGPNHIVLVDGWMNLGTAHEHLGQLIDAEKAHREALAILERNPTYSSETLAQLLNNLGATLDKAGKFIESGELLKRSLVVRSRTLGSNHPQVAESAVNLGLHYAAQRRFKDAEEYLQLALEIQRKQVTKHPMTGLVLLSLADVCKNSDRHEEAVAYYNESISYLQGLNGNSKILNYAEMSLAGFYASAERYEEAEQMLIPLVKAAETDNDPRFLFEAHKLLAKTKHSQGQQVEAEKYFTLASSFLRFANANTADEFEFYSLRGACRAAGEQWADAKVDLQRALNLAEALRHEVSGNDFEQAETFANYSQLYTLLAIVHSESGDVPKAFDAFERGLARTMIDRIKLSRADLLSGLPPNQAEEYRQTLNVAQYRVARLRNRLAAIEQQADLTDEERKKEFDEALHDLLIARARLVEAHTNIENASRLIHGIEGQTTEPVSLTDLNEWLNQRKALMIQYQVNRAGTIVFVHGRKGGTAVDSLHLSHEQANVLGLKIPVTEPSKNSIALTSLGMETVIQQLMPMLFDPVRNDEATDILATLWEVLIPESDRESLLDGQYDHLIVVPTGPLALLPFETVVVRKDIGGDPIYFLDKGPPIAYASSATVLFMLKNRDELQPLVNREPVLTIGDVPYRFGQELKFSLIETEMVKAAFEKVNMGVVSLTGSNTSEARIRQEMPGRRVLHFACHGLASQNYGNFFGGLELAPNSQENPDPKDDGYLTVAEIYELDLRGNELAILNACSTNEGPVQRGEGVWSIARSFQIAGSKRVVASAWRLNDLTTSKFNEKFVQQLAASYSAGGSISYSKALHEARLAVRKHARWPYYWAPFVFVGPPD